MLVLLCCSYLPIRGRWLGQRHSCKYLSTSIPDKSPPKRAITLIPWLGLDSQISKWALKCINAKAWINVATGQRRHQTVWKVWPAASIPPMFHPAAHDTFQPQQWRNHPKTRRKSTCPKSFPIEPCWGIPSDSRDHVPMRSHECIPELCSENAMPLIWSKTHEFQMKGKFTVHRKSLYKAATET